MEMKINWVEMTPTPEDFAFWLKQKYNVLLVGSHGIGKTTMVKEAFVNAGLNYRYFSASTMEPWVDFIGVPKEQVDEKGAYLELVKPLAFRDDTVQALFFDEYNRAPSKVCNAVMELIQFKSINGKKFDNLDVVWAAINDADDISYNTDELDWAQLDRFHIIIKLPSAPNLAYFKKKWGSDGGIVCSWWKSLPEQLKSFISPRRLEYALELYKAGGSLEQCLPANSGVKTLIKNLKNGMPYDVFLDLIKQGDQLKLKGWLMKEENFSQIEDKFVSNHLDYFKLLDQETQTKFVKNLSVRNYISANPGDYSDLIINLRTSKEKDVRTWASNLYGKVQGTAPVGTTAWVPSTFKQNLQTEVIYNYAGTVFKPLFSNKNTLPTNSVGPQVTDALLANVVPDKYITNTYKKLEKVIAILDHVNSSNLCVGRVTELLAALNYWTFGLQEVTIKKSMWSSSNQAAIGKLLAYYIQLNPDVTPETLFIQYQYIFVLYKHLGLKWI